MAYRSTDVLMHYEINTIPNNSLAVEMFLSCSLIERRGEFAETIENKLSKMQLLQMIIILQIVLLVYLGLSEIDETVH